MDGLQTNRMILARALYDEAMLGQERAIAAVREGRQELVHRSKREANWQEAAEQYARKADRLLVALGVEGAELPVEVQTKTGRVSNAKLATIAGRVLAMTGTTTSDDLIGRMHDDPARFSDFADDVAALAGHVLGHGSK